MQKKQIIFIAAEHIRPHPEYPRKKLEDLSELVESIKKNGIMQSLTVTPVEGEPGEYMTIIGHRRYAAGIQAGVTEFPCQITKIPTFQEQISIMLEENMQHVDADAANKISRNEYNQIAKETGTFPNKYEILPLDLSDYKLNKTTERIVDYTFTEETTDKNGNYLLKGHCPYNLSY